MPDLNHTLYIINSLHSVTITMTEYARDIAALDKTARLSDFEDVPELLAEALTFALDAMPEDRLTEDRTQLLAALRRYLDGWAS